MKPTDTDRKLAYVTGASSGIGYELARQFAKNGYDVIVTAENDIESAAQRIQSEFANVKIDAIRCDLRKGSEVDKLSQFIEATGRPVAACAINAGVGVGGNFETNDLQEELDSIALNVTSTVHLAKHTIRRMLSQGQGGRILFTSSIVANMPSPYQAVYAATKAFVQNLSEGLRYEMKDKGIKITALQPNATDTEFFERGGMMDTKVGQAEKDDPALVAEQGFEALMDDKDHQFGGSLMSRVQGMVSDMIPEQMKAGMNAKQTKPGSASEELSKKKAS